MISVGRTSLIYLTGHSLGSAVVIHTMERNEIDERSALLAARSTFVSDRACLQTSRPLPRGRYLNQSVLLADRSVDT